MMPEERCETGRCGVKITQTLIFGSWEHVAEKLAALEEGWRMLPESLRITCSENHGSRIAVIVEKAELNDA